MISFDEDASEIIAFAAKHIGNAISADNSPGHDAAGGTVGCLTSGVMGVTAGLVRIAEAIDNLAEAIRESNGDA
jgi:hypothetical protein